MALEFAHGAIQWLTTDANGSDKVVSGLSFQPKAIRFYWNGIQSATDAASEALSGYLGVGFTDGTNRRAVQAYSADAAGNMDTESGVSINNAVVWLQQSGGTEVGVLDIQSIDSNGFTLDVVNSTTVNMTVFWEAWGGSDITNVTVGDMNSPTTTSSTNFTATGFTSTDNDTQVVMCASVQCSTAAQLEDTDHGFSVGFATGTADQVVVGLNQDDASASSDTDGYCQSGQMVATVVEAGGTTFDVLGALSAFGTDLFTVSWTIGTAQAHRGAYMAIKGGNWKAGELTIAGNSASATTEVNTLTFAPIGLSVIGRMSAESTANTAGTEARIGLGSGSSTSSRRSLGYWDETGPTATEIDLAVEYDQILVHPSNAGGVLTAFDISAFGSNGFTLITDVAGGVASEWIGYLAFGSAVASTTANLSATEQEDTFSGSGAVSIAANASVTEESDSLSGSVALTVTANASLVEEPDTLSGVIGQPPVDANLSATEAEDAVTAATAVAIDLNLTVAEEADSVSASSAVAIDANLAATEEPDSLTADGTIAAVGTNASLSATELDDYVDASATVGIDANLAATEEQDSLTADGTIAALGINAALSATEANDSISAAATAAVAANLSATEADDSVAASSSVAITANASLTEEGDTLAASGDLSNEVVADFLATEADDTVTASATVAVGLSVQITEDDDTSSATASWGVTAEASITEDNDTSDSLLGVLIVANAAFTEEDDTLTADAGEFFPTLIVKSEAMGGVALTTFVGGPSVSGARVGSITKSEFPTT